MGVGQEGEAGFTGTAAELDHAVFSQALETTRADVGHAHVTGDHDAAEWKGLADRAFRTAFL